jgi:hypothetical protein
MIINPELSSGEIEQMNQPEEKMAEKVKVLLENSEQIWKKEHEL